MPSYKAERPKRKPIHPGGLLRREALPALKLSVSQAARDLGVTRQFLHRLLNEEVPVSAEMALKIGRLCGNGPELWLNLQSAYDLWEVKQRLGAEIDAVPERHKAA